jgi:hypothetical protein
MRLISLLTSLFFREARQDGNQGRSSIAFSFSHVTLLSKARILIQSMDAKKDDFSGQKPPFRL